MAKIDILYEAFATSRRGQVEEIVDQLTGASSFVPRPRTLAHVDTSDWQRRLERTATGFALHTWPRNSGDPADHIQVYIPADTVMWLIKSALELMAYEYRGDDF